ncbi:MAG: DUF4389 domain-containing protein [Candidatus Staskawiczbacteria bacterium]|nr:DUF4389 domain-containing protein [Candidatus Staskawiczbacteria bacterium]
MENNYINEKQNMEEEYLVKFEVKYPEKSSRILAFLGIFWFFPKIILLIPHLIVFWFLGIASSIMVWFGFWVVVFTGKYPKYFFNFIVGVLRWQNRVSVWMYGLTDKYPPFSL